MSAHKNQVNKEEAYIGNCSGASMNLQLKVQLKKKVMNSHVSLGTFYYRQ
jgi:hypothetical protein